MDAPHDVRYLADSVSPYLRMHADDPVAWRRWGVDALREARESNRLIFLSCGYAACHWCHVMQRESFRDPETAAYLNERFVCVKVDREERPDIDSTYQAYVAATTGSGGWPLTVFLSPDGAPLLGGTYFPKHAPEGGASLIDAAEAVLSAWHDDPERAAKVVEEALAFLQRPGTEVELPATAPFVTNAAEEIMHWVDREHGGFGKAPKFPMHALLEFMLVYAEVADDAIVLMEVERAVRGMLRGGVYDQVGGGMFRYSTDARWLVPHFEKMLYDNGLLLSTLAHLYRLRPEEEYAIEAKRTAAFLVREMAADGVGFVSSLSAETRGVEGATYTWLYEELVEALSAEELVLAERYLGVTEHGVLGGMNVITRAEGRDTEAGRVDALLERLAAMRAERPQPPRDTKVITSWNAWAAKGLIEAGEAMGDPGLLDRGVATLRFLLDAVVDGDEVVHVLGDPDVADVRLVEDYAALVSACLAAWDLADQEDLLDVGRRLHEAALERFYEDGVVWMAAGETLLPARPRDEHDDPTPAGSSLLVLNAVRLARATGDDSYRDFVAPMLPRLTPSADLGPLTAGTALTAILEHLAVG